MTLTDRDVTVEVVKETCRVVVEVKVVEVAVSVDVVLVWLEAVAMPEVTVAVA